MGEKRESSKLSFSFTCFNLFFYILDRMTMLDEQFLSDVELQERQHEIEHNIKNIE
jgi:hypothetical protein